MTKYNLPNRKWYTLDQAVRYINKKANEQLEVADLLHFWGIGKLDICTTFFRSAGAIRVGQYTFSDKNAYMCDIYGENVLNQEIEDIFSIKDEGKEKVEELKTNSVIIRVTQSLDKELDDYIFINGFMRLAGSNGKPETISNLFEAGISLNMPIFLISPKEIKEEIVISFQAFTEDSKEHRLSINDLYILHSDLELFLKGKSDSKTETYYEQNQAGRPSLREKGEIIYLAKEIAQKYPEATRGSIVTAVIDYFDARTELQLSESTVQRYLKEANIGKQNGKSIAIKLNP